MSCCLVSFVFSFVALPGWSANCCFSMNSRSFWILSKSLFETPSGVSVALFSAFVFFSDLFSAFSDFFFWSLAGFLRWSLDDCFSCGFSFPDTLANGTVGESVTADSVFSFVPGSKILVSLGLDCGGFNIVTCFTELSCVSLACSADVSSDDGMLLFWFSLIWAFFCWLVKSVGL